uniref:Uncharacterized protein n=1 Tax=Glossina palpalis gambiensis TaxID=67801 RepID=A0A1B0BBU6_9MUSC
MVHPLLLLPYTYASIRWPYGSIPIFMLHTYIAKAMYFEIFKIMLLGQQWQWIYADITLSQQT